MQEHESDADLAKLLPDTEKKTLIIFNRNTGNMMQYIITKYTMNKTCHACFYRVTYAF